MSATYTKLRDQSWGVRVTGQVTSGQTVTVAKKDGSTKVETIGRVLWKGDGVCLCSIAGSRASNGRTSTERRYMRYGWDGVRGSSSYYTSGMYDEES